MKREELLAEMKGCIGTQEPVVFFEKMVDVFDMLFDRIDELDAEVHRVKLQSALAIQWEPKMASAMLAGQINFLRQDKDTYFNEITELKKAFVEDSITQNYNDFCEFWTRTLGWHPFLEYK
jgi:hypothetical protein